MKPLYHISIILLLLCGAAFQASAQGNRNLNDKVLNRPYADQRRWHLGFSVGTHTQNLLFTHNGYITPDGQEWRIEQPSYSPGFCVNGLVDFRLSNYFSLRISPGLYFGNRNIEMLDASTGATERQNIKSTFIVAPVDIKYSALRMRNIRPYMTAGVMPAFDVSKKSHDFLQLKSTDLYLTVGFGCDFYLPFFKLIPEIKFCFGLKDVLQHDRPDLAEDIYGQQFTKSLTKATSRMIVLSFYFE